MKRKLTMQMPREIAVAISRRHFGREGISRNDILDAIARMNLLFVQWEKAHKHLEWVLDVFWEEEKIENHFGSPKFYGAHRRLRNARTKVEELHRQMFYLMVHTDGNYETFSVGGSLDARSIAEDFNNKYLKRLR